MRTYVSLFVLGACLLAIGCQPVSIATNFPVEATPSPTPEPFLPTQGAGQVTPSLPTAAVPELQKLIETAMSDLAQRLAVSVSNIVLLEATRVTWPDTSLGCPQEGMGYAQVLTPGYLIRLRAGDQEYEYHANRETYVIYCENPLPPLPGDPPDV